MAFPLLVVFGFITKPPTMIRLFAELFGHYLAAERRPYRADAHFDLHPRATGDGRPYLMKTDPRAVATLRMTFPR
jgi:hypothetical protein